jgi:hypothetical protein
VGPSIDAPAYLQLTFGEVPGDVAESFLPYTGTLSESWLPWETIHVDYLPQQVNMPRRLERGKRGGKGKERGKREREEKRGIFHYPLNY